MANKILVKCYGKVREYASRKEAIEEYSEAVSMTEGSEQARYATILASLMDRTCFYATDEG